MAAVIWIGPVDLKQVSGATVPGAKVYSVNCRGDAIPDCEAIGLGFKDGDGRYLPGLLANFGLTLASAGEVYVGSFSAGHEIAKPMLLVPEDRAAIKAVMLADSFYTTWLDEANRVPAPPEGYVRYALDAISGSHMLVGTASSFSKKYASGVETMAAFRAEVEARAGRKFEDGMGAFAGVDPKPLRAWKLGNVILGDYGGTVPHGDHASVLAKQVWQSILAPWAALQPPGPGSELSDWRKWLAIAVGLAAGYAGVRAWQRRKERR